MSNVPLLAAVFPLWRRRPPQWDRVVTIGLLIAGGLATFDAFTLAVHEEWRQRYGTTTTGTVISRITNSAEPSIGDGVRKRHGLPRDLDRFDRTAARWIRTGSGDVWWVEFEYPSQGTLWRGGDTVSRVKWMALEAGQRVAVRFDPSRQDYTRAALEGESDLPDAFTQAAVGTTTIALAGIFSRWMKPRKARRRLSATALVTGVKATGRARWQVEFAFLDEEGTKHECVQEFIRDVFKPGQEGLADYEPGRPHDAVIIPVPARAEGEAEPS